ncbi:MAG: cell division transport system ATP-binding protein [Candidatus Peribacteria bacterium]|nr:cell division transport system ATP-binding protein [Candidatus Peribacteria bacterium]
MLELKNVTKRFGDMIVLDDVSFAVQPQEFLCITGPSGAGKSTLISLIIGGDIATGGSIEIDGMDLRKVPRSALQLFRRRVGVVFQDYKLLDNRTVSENIAFPLEVCGAPDDVIRVRVPELLEQVGMTRHAGAFPRELSGGEKTRVAIARAIVHQPIIILADEPTGNVDPEQAKSILSLFKNIHEKGTTVILATHDATLVDKLQTRVIRLEDGKIVRDSVGGYYGSKGHSHTHAPAAKEQPEEKPAASEDAKTKKNETSKIRITSIGG